MTDTYFVTTTGAMGSGAPDGLTPAAAAAILPPSATAWGGITGTLSSQTDLQAALDAKTTLAIVLGVVFPVGSIYSNAADNTNPGTLFGFGTWVAQGAGRVPVCLDGTQTEFDTIGETGGAKTVTLDTTMIPAHSHTQDAHSHIEQMNTATTGATGAGFPAVADASTSGGPGALWVSTATTVAVNQNTGGGAAHNNLSPYIVEYRWKRTA